MPLNTKNWEINPRLIYPFSRIIEIEYSGYGTTLVQILFDCDINGVLPLAFSETGKKAETQYS